MRRRNAARHIFPCGKLPEREQSRAMDEGNITILCKNELGETERVQRKIAQFCELLGISGRPLHALNLAIDEVLTNIIRHGFGDGAAHEIRIRMDMHGDALTAEVEDDGREFNPLKYPPVDCTK